MVAIGTLISGAILIYIASTGRGEAIWKALTNPKKKQ